MIREIKKINLEKIARDHLIPLDATVEITTQCNNNCCHCYLDRMEIYTLNYNDIYNVFIQLKTLGTLFITITGGEIFLHPDIMRIISSARKLGFSVNILSNATMLNDTIINELSALYIESFGTTIFSLDHKIHDTITETPGSLKNTMNNLAKIKQKNISVEIKTPVMELNKNSLLEIADFCLYNKFRFVPSSVLFNKRNGDNSVKKFNLSDEDLLKIMDIILLNISEEAEQYIHLDQADPSICPNIKSRIFIDAQGTVHPCIGFLYPLGSIYKNSIDEILNKNNQRKYLLSLNKNMLKDCMNCYLKDKCTRCPGLALLEDGSIFVCSSSAKRIAVAEYKINKRRSFDE